MGLFLQRGPQRGRAVVERSALSVVFFVCPFSPAALWVYSFSVAPAWSRRCRRSAILPVGLFVCLCHSRLLAWPPARSRRRRKIRTPPGRTRRLPFCHPRRYGFIRSAWPPARSRRRRRSALLPVGLFVLPFCHPRRYSQPAELLKAFWYRLYREKVALDAMNSFTKLSR